MPKKKRPAKPHKDFPLFAHANGQWAKKIRGALWYFGTWEDADAALQTYLDEKDDILAGRDPRAPKFDGLTVRDLINHYLTAMEKLTEKDKASGGISLSHFADLNQSCQVMAKHFGNHIVVSQLKVADFTALKNAFPATWKSPNTIGNHLHRMKGVFNWAYEREMIPVLPRFGPDFRRPSEAAYRAQRGMVKKDSGERDLTIDEVQAILSHATGWFKPCVLLGINAGFGNTDCALLEMSDVDFETGWYDVYRNKNGIDRRSWFWPETREAIRSALENRNEPKKAEDSDLCFITRQGNSVSRTGISEANKKSRTCTVGERFLELVRELGIHRRGVGFYSLRKTAATVASEVADLETVKICLGQETDKIMQRYRQRIFDEKIKTACDHIREWVNGQTNFLTSLSD